MKSIDLEDSLFLGLLYQSLVKASLGTNVMVIRPLQTELWTAD